MFLQLALLPPLGHKEAIGTLGYPIASKLEDQLALEHLSVDRQTDKHLYRQKKNPRVRLFDSIRLCDIFILYRLFVLQVVQHTIVYSSTFIRVSKSGSLGAWRSHSLLQKCKNTMYQLFLIPKPITGSILTLLQYTMTLLQGPKDPVLPSLMYVHRYEL